MRTAIGLLACVVIGGCATVGSEPVVHSPWQVVKNAPWADKRLTGWGFLPATHDGKNYYCLSGNHPQVGTRLPTPSTSCGDTSGVLTQCWTSNPSPTAAPNATQRYSCGDAGLVATMYFTGWRPTYLVYGMQ